MKTVFDTCDSCVLSATTDCDKFEGGFLFTFCVVVYRCMCIFVL